MGVDGVLEAPGKPALEPLDRALEVLVLEHRHPAATLADEVMMVIAAGIGGLIPGRVRELDAPHEVDAREQVERSVDARDADVAALRAKAVEDVLRRHAALLPPHQLDHGGARAPAAVAPPLQLGERVLDPLASSFRGVAVLFGHRRIIVVAARMRTIFII